MRTALHRLFFEGRSCRVIMSGSAVLEEGVKIFRQTERQMDRRRGEYVNGRRERDTKQGCGA